MSKFVKRFRSTESAKAADDLITPNLSGVYVDGDKHFLWKSSIPKRGKKLKIVGDSLHELHYEDYPTCLYFEAVDYDITVKMQLPDSPLAIPAFEISYDDEETWSSYNIGTEINVSAGEKVYFRGDNEIINRSDADSEIYKFVFSGAGKVNVGGELNSLLSKSSYNGLSLSGKSYCYCRLFDSCEKIVSIDNLKLSSIVLAENCYNKLFYNCVGLNTVPSDLLSNGTLEHYCYYGMFEGCLYLTSAPKLPASTLSQGCYSCMFKGCTSLTTAPDLLAANLVQECYYNMFSSCYSLNYIKCTADNYGAVWPADCFTNWVQNVASSGVFYKAYGTMWDYGESGIPVGWDVRVE